MLTQVIPLDLDTPHGSSTSETACNSTSCLPRTTSSAQAFLMIELSASADTNTREPLPAKYLPTLAPTRSKNVHSIITMPRIFSLQLQYSYGNSTGHNPILTLHSEQVATLAQGRKKYL